METKKGSGIACWLAVLAAAAAALWLPSYALIPLVAFVLFRILLQIVRGPRRPRRDRFRESLKTAERALESI